MTLTVEQLAEDAIDVLELNRAGLLTGDWVSLSPSVRWPSIAAIRLARFRIVIEYRHRSVPQSIQISWTRCNYGGGRPYFHCPDCDRRAWRAVPGPAGLRLPGVLRPPDLRKPTV